MVRPYKPEDETGVLALWEAAFEKVMPSSLWRWKYLESPYPVQIAVCLDENGEVVVVYGGIPYRANWKGRKIFITHLADIMSHPDYRRSGLFVKMGSVFFEFFAGPQLTPFYYGFPGKVHFEIGKKYLLYQALEGGVGHFSANTDPLAQRKAQMGWRIEKMTRGDELLDSLWKRVQKFYPFAVIRDASFFQWRFFARPGKRYECYGYRSFMGREWKGYVVFDLQDHHATLVDLLMPPSQSLVSDFLGRVSHQLSLEGVKTMAIWLPAEHFLVPLLLSAGFVSAPEPLGFVPTGRSFDPALELEWVGKNLYYTMADGDLF